MSRALWMGGFCVLVCSGCSNNAGSGGNGDGGATTDDGGSSGSSGAGSSSGGGNSSGSGGSSSGTGSGGSGGGTAKSLVGTWDLTTTPMGSGSSVPTTVVIGQDSLTVTSPSFSLTAVRTGNSVAYTDMAPGAIVLNATQTAAPFDSGILPFNLGGSWAMQITQGAGTVETCTLSVSATEIDGSCQKITDGFNFSFTTKKLSSAASVLGDFGGKWMNMWTDPSASGGTWPCELDFLGDGITTCTPGDAAVNGNLLQRITFAYDGANTASGVAQGWAEYSATRR